MPHHEDETVILEADLGCTVQLDWSLVLALPIAVMRTVDDHGHLLESHC